MNVRKLPSGNYQVRKQYKSTKYSFTFDHKPTSKEVALKLAEILEDNQVEKGSFEEYANKYIKSKENILSPSTIIGYKSSLKNMGELKYKNLNRITAEDVQIEINNYSINHSPKTVRNLHGFISSVLGFYRPFLTLRTTLPQKEKKEPYIPSDEVVRQVLDYFKGDEYEVAIWLCALGLRKGEVCALTLEDLSEDNMITINKAISDSDKGIIVKSPKTPESNRVIAIPDYVANRIREQGFVFRRHPSRILKHLNKCQDKLGIERFSLHKLRHYFASTLSSSGVAENDILKLGGWSSPYVMKAVYRHSMIDKDNASKKKVANIIGKKVGTKIGTKSRNTRK